MSRWVVNRRVLFGSSERFTSRQVCRSRVGVPGALIGLTLLAGGMLLGGDVAATDGLYCDGKIVAKGDQSYRVRKLCGNPDAESERYERRTVQRRVTGPCDRDRRDREDADKDSGRDDDQRRAEHSRGEQRKPPRDRECTYYERHTVEVVIQRWTYDFGENRLLHHLDFENAELIRVRTSGYGDKEPAN